MFSRNRYAARRFTLSLIIALLLTAFLCGLMIRGAIGTTQQSHRPGVVSLFQDGDENPKTELSGQQRSLEARAWHAANLGSLEWPEAPGAEALTENVISEDREDLTIIQGDRKIVAPPKTFDLNLRAVSFTPVGAGYAISTINSLFDNNLGVPLDLTRPPAVNPKAGAEPGDEAYIVEELGFSFTYFGNNYPAIAISSNGNLVFRPQDVTQTEFDMGAVSSIATLSEFQSGLPRIAAYWHDLDARNIPRIPPGAIYFRKTSDRVLITWNYIRDFPNTQIDTGLHRFQVTLFNNGRIVLTYDAVELITRALVGITPGQTKTPTTLIDLSAPPSTTVNTPVAEFFSTSTRVDYISAVKAFYDAHPGRDVYDFIYVMTDFDYDRDGALAFYDPLRNDAYGIGLKVDPGTTDLFGSRKLQGILNLGYITGSYPPSPTTRFLGANHALSIIAQEQGHRWLSFAEYPGNDPLLLLGRNDAHWSFFLHTESTISHPAARRSSAVEGNVWNDNGNGTFTSVGLIDGYSQLDQYLMGLRPDAGVEDTFVITNTFGANRTRESFPQPGVTISGSRQPVTIKEIIAANGTRTPNSTQSQKDFRAAIILVVRQGSQPSPVTLNKIALYRLAWESYFEQSTDYRATIHTGIDLPTASRGIATVSAASYLPVLAPGELATIFGEGAIGSPAFALPPLPTTLANVQIRVNGVMAPLSVIAHWPIGSKTYFQINFQVPRTTIATTSNPLSPSATALVEVLSDGQLVRAGTFLIAPTAPALFSWDTQGDPKIGHAKAFDGANEFEPFNAKLADGQPNKIAILGTGFGGDATDVGGEVTASMQAVIDGNRVTVNYAGRAGVLPGVNQINITFPDNIASGEHKLVISRNGIASNTVPFLVK